MSRRRNRPRAAAVVCCYTMRRWSDIVASVDSLLAQQTPLDEVIVVVDHNDELFDRCSRQWPRGVLVVANDGRQGLADGRNAGLRATDCEVVLFLDDDAVAGSDWSERLVECYGDDRVVGAGGHIEPYWATGSAPSWWPRAFDWVVGCSYTGMPTSRTPVRNVIGANMSVRRDAALEIGGFNPDMGRVGTRPLGGEETELYIRIAQARPGTVVLYEPRATVRHHVTPERATWAYFRSRCYAEGLTKAALSRNTTSSEALSSETTYVSRVLPREFVRGLFSGDPRRGLAVVGGLTFTGLGYARGLASVAGAAGGRGLSERAAQAVSRVSSKLRRI